MEPATVTTDLPRRAEELVPLLDQNADAGDEQRTLTDDVVDALHRERLWGMWVPQVLGGSELDPVPSLEVIERLTYGDPSVGWVHMAASLAIGTGGAYLGDEALERGIRMTVSSWRRHDPNIIPPMAKVTGAYINSVIAKIEAVRAGVTRLQQAFTAHFQCPLSRVGTIQVCRGVTLRLPDGTQQPLSARGYDHFRTHTDDTTEAPDA